MKQKKKGVQVNLFNRLKDSILEVLKSRLFVLIVVFCILSAILVQRVFYLQIVKGEDYLNNYKLKIKKTKNIQGTRGVIFDRNGEVLATNKLAYSVQIEDNGSYEDTKQKNKLINKTINSVIDMVEKNGDSIVNDFGIILNSNNEYEFLYAEGTRRLRFLADIYGYTTIDKLSEKEKNSTPQEVMDFLCANKRGKSWGFGIDQEKYEKSRVLQLVTIRYGMHLNSFQKYIPTTIASDVSDETVAVIMENLSDLQGISIGEESLRVYPDSKYFSSILGYTGKISQEEYDELSEEQQKSYSLTDIVGKSGIEQTMDEYLQGEKGKETVWQFIQPYLKSTQEFELRFGIVMLLHYIDEGHIDLLLKYADSFCHDAYYARMAMAWMISICFVKFPEKTMEYLKHSKLDNWTYNKSLQKTIESLRIDKRTKDVLRSMKRR